MDKNTITGFVLIALILIGFSWWSRPSEEEQRAAFVKDSIEQVNKANAEQQRQTAQNKQRSLARQKALADTNALFHNAMTGEEQKIVLQNSKLSLTLNSKGAAVEKVVVKQFKDRFGNPDMVLFDGKDQSISYMLAAKETNISTSDLYFEPTEISDSTVVFTAQASEGKNIVMSYRLGADYMLHMQMRVNGMGGLFAPNTSTMDVNWYDMCRQQEKGFTFENRYSSRP